MRQHFKAINLITFRLIRNITLKTKTQNVFKLHSVLCYCIMDSLLNYFPHPLNSIAFLFNSKNWLKITLFQVHILSKSVNF